ncbi:maleylacetate reductase [Streptacidiphilus jiangxiensis]|uniref:Maleylacetate reductase n=1 Tax=Streptacidiphilus jiangxiensis TaxID=235985 RepID=A0A1H7ZFS3_STRJI|nr:maleylacetate reductase [Streptacidiphilus jiangxiensis]SEM56388.1 maleylacetate reductase [Streptacidiphilus jiangxiensis]
MTALQPFTYHSLPMRVVFGPGVVASLPQEIERLGYRRALVLCGPQQQATGGMVADALGSRAAGVLAEARMHVPLEVADLARQRARELGADCCVAVGGGSAVGLGKAVALEHGLPVLAVPTTYAGSEMTPVWGLTENGRKRTGRDPRVLPVSVFYDPELTLTLPVGLSVTSAVNAAAHAVEALYAPDANPVISLMAEEGVRALVDALPAVVRDPGDLEARGQAQYGAWLSGACLGATTMSLHHKLCHSLGGTLDLPHAPTHTVVLPHALAYNQRGAPQAVAALSRALGGAADPARRFFDLAGELGAPRSLRELGMAETAIARIVDEVLANPYANPVEVTAEGLTALLHAAWAGEPPQAAGPE